MSVERRQGQELQVTVVTRGEDLVLQLGGGEQEAGSEVVREVSEVTEGSGDTETGEVRTGVGGTLAVLPDCLVLTGGELTEETVRSLLLDIPRHESRQVPSLTEVLDPPEVQHLRPARPASVELSHQLDRLLELPEHLLPAGLLQHHQLHVQVAPTSGGDPLESRGKQKKLYGI